MEGSYCSLYDIPNALLKLQLTPEITLTVIQVYAPTFEYSDQEPLNTACEENRGTWNLVFGDFNAKLRNRQISDSDTILGQFGLGNSNDHDNRLIHFAFGQSVIVANSFYSK